MGLPRLLLVDDSQAVLDLERAVLGAAYLCDTAHDGAEAIVMLGQRAYDAMVLDLSMPAMDGDEALRRIRMEPRWGHLPVLVVSSEEARAESLVVAGAAQAWLGKPVTARALNAAVAGLFERRERERHGRPCLPCRAGGRWFALPLACVDAVCPMPALAPAPRRVRGVSGVLAWGGERRLVLETGGQADRADRWLVLLNTPAWRPALAVDAVGDPQAPAEDEAWPPLLDPAACKPHWRLERLAREAAKP